MHSSGPAELVRYNRAGYNRIDLKIVIWSDGNKKFVCYKPL